MELKGEVVKKLKPEKKKKMEETLKRMEKIRDDDAKKLRYTIKEKLDWAIEEQKKGIKNIQENQVQVQRLQGIIIVLTELLEKPKDDSTE